MGAFCGGIDGGGEDKLASVLEHPLLSEEEEEVVLEVFELGSAVFLVVASVGVSLAFSCSGLCG